MRAAKKTAESIKILQDLVPLNALSDDRFTELAEKIVIEVVKSGRFLFRKGDRDNRSAYLLEGKVSLIDERRRVIGEVVAGTDESRHPLANQQPRPLSARAAGKTVVAYIDSGLLDVFLTWDQSNTAEAVELDVEDASDWMTRLLKSETFRKLPPSKLQGLLVRMKPFPVKRGDVVISEGEEGDYFYTIHEGRCQVTTGQDDGNHAVLAELAEGDSFGEEALVSNDRRNATITMLTDGQLMRLAKQDFEELLKTQLLRYVDYTTAAEMVTNGAVWLDVRTPDEYDSGYFEDSVNLPLADLRGEMPELVYNASYIICCDTGSRSDSAGFVLSHRGFDVYVLEGGMSSLPAGIQLQTDSGNRPPAGAVSAVGDAGDTAEASATAAETDLSRENAGLQAANEALVSELGQQHALVETISTQMEQMRGELGEATEKLGEMYSRLSKQTREKQLLEERLETQQTEYSGQLESLQQVLARLEQQNAALTERAAADAAMAEEQSSRNVQSLLAEKQQLSGDLTASQGQVAALEEELRQLRADATSREDADSAVRTLQEENTRLAEQLDLHEVSAEKLQERLSAEESGRDEREHEHAEQVRQLDETARQLKDELAAAHADIDRLQEQNCALQEEHDQAATHLQQQAESRQHADEQLARLQTDAATRQEELQDRLTTEMQTSADLRARLEQLEENRQTTASQAEHQVREVRELAAARQQELTEQLEALGQRLTEQEAHRHAIEQERDELSRQLDAAAVATDEKLASITASAGEEISALQQLLEEEQHTSQTAARMLEEKDRQISSLQQTVEADDTARQSLEEENGLLRHQLDDALELLQQREEHARELEVEYAESLSRSHDELTRKNDTEKELQGQIDRLRKKLEQVSKDHQKSRETSIDELDSLREDLHLERQARAEERAQMAARQRELKEQLAAIAVQHEANMTDQSGAIEEARDAVREEERSRLQSLMDSHAETEEQLARVQAELQKAHEEITVLDQQEKARRQAEIDAIQEQNEQAESAITQLENQLRQLTRERDDALNDQHELRVKVNALRGEVEVARGLMTAGGKGRIEDPEQLRAELDQTRKDVKIAVRLRAEAETAREQMAAELRRLQALHPDESEAGDILNVPSLDDFDPLAEQKEVPGMPSSLVPEPVVAATARKIAESPDGGRRSRLLVRGAAGAALVAVIVMVAWFVRTLPEEPQLLSDTVIPGTEQSPLTVDKADAGESADSGTDEDTAPAMVLRDQAVAEVAETPAVLPGPAEQGIALPDAQPSREQPVSGPVSQPVASVTTAGTQPDFVGPRPLQRPPETRAGQLISTSAKEPPPPMPSGPPPVGRSFRDALKGSGKGPAMIELLPASFEMGSIGNSLNFDEGPRHTVTLPAYSISKREISFAEYDRFARATGRRLPYDETWGRNKQPVINVSWHDAVAYTRWLSRQTGRKYRLPSEAEWEYAARGGSSWSYWWSDVNTVPANCFDCGSDWDGTQTAPVGSFRANWFGLHDMSGNVQEWTADCYHNSYTGAPVDGSAWVSPDCSQRVVRGGAYSSPLDSLRSAKRSQLSQDTRLDNLGFRVVRAN